MPLSDGPVPDGGPPATDGAAPTDAGSDTGLGGCTSACSSGICGTTIHGWSSTPWLANGSASFGAGQFGAMTGILTTTADDQAGTIIYPRPVVVDSFTATFSFYIGAAASDGGVVSDSDGQVVMGADGLAFAFETNGPTAVTDYGACFGVCGLDGFGVELDTYDNDGCGDTNANHVAVDSLTACMIADETPLPTLIGSVAQPPFQLADGAAHTAVIELANGAISVTLDGTTVLTAIALPGFTPGGQYYFGFGGGTGDILDFHEIGPDLTITFPTPRCL
jgi:hypothetical protein